LGRIEPFSSYDLARDGTIGSHDLARDGTIGSQDLGRDDAVSSRNFNVGISYFISLL